MNKRTTIIIINDDFITLLDDNKRSIALIKNSKHY